MVARLPLLVDQASLARNAKAIQECLGGDSAQAMQTALDLQAAVYELRLQNLRAWRPDGWRPRIALSGAEHVRAALATGRGAVLWVGHFAFNSNITKMALAKHGHRLAHMSRPEHGFSKTRLGIALLNPVRCIPEDRHLQQRIVFDRRNPADRPGTRSSARRAARPGIARRRTAGRCRPDPGRPVRRLARRGAAGCAQGAARPAAGLQLSLFGLAGIIVAPEEGIEVNVLSLSVGVDVLRPALRLPFIGRVGMDDTMQRLD